MDNAAIHKTAEVKFWVAERSHQILFLPPYSPFLNLVEEFWAKLKDVVKKDPASVRKNTQLSERIRHASDGLTQIGNVAHIGGNDPIKFNLIVGQIQIADPFSLTPNQSSFQHCIFLVAT